MQQWQRFATPDQGFANRPAFSAPWGRLDDNAQDRAAGNAHKVQLLLDDRDATTAADFLRFELSVTSRYAPLFTERGERLALDPASGDTYRRIFAPLSATTLKPPKVLSVVQLTQ